MLYRNNATVKYFVFVLELNHSRFLNFLFSVRTFKFNFISVRASFVRTHLVRWWEHVVCMILTTLQASIWNEINIYTTPTTCLYKCVSMFKVQLVHVPPALTCFFVFSAQCMFMGFIWYSEQTAIIPYTELTNSSLYWRRAVFFLWHGLDT